MIKPKLYLDTSVPSAYFDARAPDRQQLTQQFWRDRLSAYDSWISDLVLEEIHRTPDDAARAQMLSLVSPLGVLAYAAECEDIVAAYLDKGVFGRKTLGDAIHVAIAVANGIGYLASWNFKHLVRVSTRREINLVNSLNGWGPIEIVAPPEL